MYMRTCTENSCGRAHYARGFCVSHYRKWQRHGTPDPLPRQYRKMNRTCSVSGCEEKHCAREYCSRHYGHWKHHGDPLISYRNWKECSVVGCPRKHSARGLCRMHWKRQRYGSMPMDAPERYLLHPQSDEERREHRVARHQVRRARSDTLILPSDVLAAWGTDCHICGEPVDLGAPRRAQNGKDWERGLHLDHVMPLAAGGTHTIDNVKPSHAICNLRKQ